MLRVTGNEYNVLDGAGNWANVEIELMEIHP